MKRNLSLLLCLLLCALLTAASALCLVSCTDTPTETPQSPEGGSPAETPQSGEQSTSAETREVGEGARHFTLSVFDDTGAERRFLVHTDRETVGEALLEVGLISGEDGPYGLYIKTVDGITADYDKNGRYWSFYVDGAYAMQSADATPITDGALYALRVEG